MSDTAATSGDPPLLITVDLDEVSTEWFDALRRAHFPAERNHLRAHVSMFHALPGHELAAIGSALADASARPAFAVEVGPPMLLGRGVAYPLSAPELNAVRDELATRFDPWLTAQDRQPYRPHVTVQNKVDPAVAKALHAELTVAERPHHVSATGLRLWRYLGGPWRREADFRFTGDDHDDAART